MFVKGILKKVGVLLILAVLTFLFGYFLVSCVLLFVTIFLMQFFRDPERNAPNGNGLVVAAADGKVLKGQIDRIEPVERDEMLMEHILREGERGIRISTFMSPFDVHVQRAPVSGEIMKTKYYPGNFKAAFGDVQKENEKNLIVINSEYGKVGIIQIAGFVARRIVQYVHEGDSVKMGDRIGMIRFGSRVDVVIPASKFKILVTEGQKPKAGETVIAELIKNKCDYKRN